MIPRTLAAACLVAAGSAAASAGDAEIAEIRAEIQSLRSDYEARMADLEARLAAVASAAPSARAAGAPGTAFNPAMSLILDGRYQSFERDPENYAIGGFMPGAESAPPGDRNFSLGESELTLSANIDPHFSGYFVAAFDGEGGTEIEEAYVSHVGLVSGGTIKLGRFYSALGYQNEQHAHAWDFVDLPLAHKAFFGGQLVDDGVQFRWLVPVPMFLELGIEAGAGNGFPGSDRNRSSPGATGVFAHLGGDLGASWSYRVGGSYRWMNAEDRAYDDQAADGADVVNRFSGDVDMWGLDAVWKWAPDGDRTARNLTLQAEYLRADSRGTLMFDAEGSAQSGDFDSDQSGWYGQAVYQFMPRWRLGVRYDALDSGTVNIGLVTDGTLTSADFPLLADHDPRRWSSMLDFSPSEFSRLRLQLARDEARLDDSDAQVFFQYIMSMGAHGAHRF